MSDEALYVSRSEGLARCRSEPALGQRCIVLSEKGADWRCNKTTQGTRSLLRSE